LRREKADLDIVRVTAPQTHIHFHVLGVVWTRIPNSTFVYICDFWYWHVASFNSTLPASHLLLSSCTEFRIFKAWLSVLVSCYPIWSLLCTNSREKVEIQ